MGQRPKAKNISLIVLAVGLCAGCPEDQRVADSGTHAKPDTIPKVSVKEAEGQFYSFFDMRAEMQTVEQIQEVSETARSDVMVTDPRVRLGSDLVIVADLRKKSPSGEYRSWIESKSKWLDRVVPKTSKLAMTMAPLEPRAKRRRRKRRPRRRRRRRPAPPAEPAATPTALPTALPTAAPKAAAAQVVLFSTVWCPSCKSARRFFQSKGVPFKELDVEKDQQAQQQYLAIQRTYKLRQGVVPLIIVNGRVFQGFSRPQVEAALAAGPPRPRGPS